MTYKIEIHTKQNKVFNLVTQSIQDFLKIMSKNEILWQQDQKFGFFIAQSEICLITFTADQEEVNEIAPITCAPNCDIMPISEKTAEIPANGYAT
jgi:hypothetical protein